MLVETNVILRWSHFGQKFRNIMPKLSAHLEEIGR